MNSPGPTSQSIVNPNFLTPDSKDNPEIHPRSPSSFSTPPSSYARPSQSDTTTFLSVASRDSLTSVLRETLEKNRQSATYSTSKNRHSLVKISAEKTNQHMLDMTYLAHLDADTMLQSNPDNQAESWENLQCFLSTGRDDLAFEKIERKVRSDKVRVTRELHWLEALIQIIEKVLAENRFIEEHRKTSGPRLNREHRWSMIINQVAKQVTEGMNRDNVLAIVNEAIKNQCDDFNQQAKVAYNDKDLAIFNEDLDRYFGFRSAEVNLVESFANKTKEELTLLPPRFQLNPAEMNNFHHVNAERYVTHGLNERFKFCLESLSFSTAARDIPQETIRQQADDINQYLSTQARDMQLNHELTSSSEHLKTLLDEVKSTRNLVEEESISLQEYVAYYEQSAQQTRNTLKRHNAINAIRVEAALSLENLDERENHNQRLEKQIHDLISQKVDVLREFEGGNLLDKAISSKNILFIAKVLAYADHLGDFEKLLSTTVPKLTKETLKLLIGGAHLFDPKNGGLYNPLHMKKIYNTSNEFITLKDDQYQFTLDRDEQEKINKLILEKADDKNLAFLIKQVEKQKWLSPVTYQASDIRAELKRRFVADSDSTPESIDDYVRVRAILNKNLAIAERGERLATFYDKETRHVLASYSSSNGKGQALYTSKANLILKKFTESAEAAQTLDALESEAIKIAASCANPTDPLNERLPTFISDPRSTSKTQRMFATALDALTATGISGALRQGAAKATQILTGSDRQNDKRVLARPIETVDAGLSEALLSKIPLTSQEKRDCVKRAALARGTFKNTLEYLENRYTKDNNKRESVENHIQAYVNGVVTAEVLIEQLKNTTLKQQAWFGLWAKSGRLMNRDLANKQAFSALDPKTVAAGC